MLSPLGSHKLVRWCLATLLVAWAQGAVASVVNGNYSLAGDRQGSAGEQVSFTVHEPGLEGYDGAQLQFTFDSSVLRFRDASTDSTQSGYFGSAFPSPLSDSNGLATYALFLTSDTGPLTGSYDLFTLFFDINPGAAPGDTLLQFTNTASTPFEPGIYDRASLSGAITVVGAVPIVGTMPLAATALLLLALATRRRGASPPRLVLPGA